MYRSFETSCMMRSAWLTIALCFMFCSCLAQSVDLEEKLRTLFIYNGTDDVTTTQSPGVSCAIGHECVQRHLCMADNSVNKDGLTLIKFRLGTDDDDTPCAFLETCCDVTKKINKPRQSLGTVTPQAGGCGRRNTNGLIYNISNLHETETNFAEFPWMVALMRKQPEKGNNFVCGGSILAPTVVLTAAHCLMPGVQVLVRAGEWDLQTVNEALPYQERNIKQIIRHEQFNGGNAHNDIAILLLDAPLDFSKANVAPICLADANENYDFARCLATGWGQETYGKGVKIRNTMKKVELPIVPNDRCEAALRQTILGRHYELDASFLCAGGEKGKDTCQGDGGSPLVCLDRVHGERYQQVGIVSWGLECGKVNIPAAYANVMYLRNWLDEKLKANGIDFTHFSA